MEFDSLICWSLVLPLAYIILNNPFLVNSPNPKPIPNKLLLIFDDLS